MDTNFILFYEPQEFEILKNMLYVLDNLSSQAKKEKQQLAFKTLNAIVSFADKYCLSGNLWKNYIIYTMISCENAFTNLHEGREVPHSSLNSIAFKDFAAFKRLYDLDLPSIDKSLEISCFSHLEDFEGVYFSDKIYNHNIKNSINHISKKLDTAKTPELFMKVLTDFYTQNGTVKFGLHRAFKVAQSPLLIEPIINIDPISFDDLIGYEAQKKQLIDNTKAFIDGSGGNNCLIFGDAGTGKSSSVRALLNMFYSDGLRIIEIYKHQLHHLSSIIAEVTNRNYKFIVFMDDLSFEDSETEYKYLKAVIEGGLSKKPDNILIYATSNRRHLIREEFSDRQESSEDVHISDTIQEKLSLSARFGVTILFVRPLPAQFKNMVVSLAKSNAIDLPEIELLDMANRWDLNHGGSRTGRTAQQFIDYLLGQGY